MIYVFYYPYNFLLTNFGALIRLSEKHLSDPPPKRVLKTLTLAPVSGFTQGENHGFGVAQG